jgi:hypothetical protein
LFKLARLVADGFLDETDLDYYCLPGMRNTVSAARFPAIKMRLLTDLPSISYADIEDLQTRAVREGPQIDYKLALLPLNDTKKFEFLKDVSSMANADGGVIV